jgi:hypothetical protein
MRSLFVNIRFVIMCAGFCMVVPVEGQTVYHDHHGSDGYSRASYELELRALNEPAQQSEPASNGAAVVSADVLCHPLSSKARHELE